MIPSTTLREIDIRSEQMTQDTFARILEVVEQLKTAQVRVHIRTSAFKLQSTISNYSFIEYQTGNYTQIECELKQNKAKKVFLFLKIKEL